MKVAYHGTPFSAQVLQEGLKAHKALAVGSCEHIWLAREPKDAKPIGTVLEIDMSGIEGEFELGELGWQGCYHGGDIDPLRIKLYTGVV